MNKLPLPEEVRDFEVAYQDHDFRLNMRRVEIDELLDGSQIIDADTEKNYLIAAYLFDETELKKYMRKNQEEQLVTGLLYLDNYEEALESVEEVRSSLLIALIDRKINKYFASIDGVVKKLEKDKYFLVMRRKSLEQLKEKKFNILEEVKSVNIGNEMAVTISIGIGINADSYAHTSESARQILFLPAESAVPLLLHHARSLSSGYGCRHIRRQPRIGYLPARTEYPDH